MTSYPKTVFSPGFIQKHGLIKNAMGAFLDTQMEEIQEAISNKYPDLPNNILKKLLGRFVTLDGTKRPIGFSEIIHPGLSKEQMQFCLERLESGRILRQDDGLFEIAHDTLALHIAEQRSAEEVALLEIVKIIRDRFRVFPSTNTYLTSGELQLVKYNESYLKRENLLSKEEWEFYQASTKSRIRYKRLRQLSIILMIAVLSTFSIYSYFQKQLAVKSEEKAIAAQEVAEKNLAETKAMQLRADEARYQEQIAKGEKLRQEGKYKEALETFEVAKLYMPERTEVDSLIRETSRTKRDDRLFGELIAEGERLERLGESRYLEAKENYLEAKALGVDDDRVASLLSRLNGKINSRYNWYINRGKEFFDKKAYPFALENYLNAQKLKDTDPALSQKIRECQRQINNNND